MLTLFPLGVENNIVLGGRGLVLVWACSAGTQKPNAFNMFEIHFISIKF